MDKKMGEKIKKYRKMKGLSRKELGELIDRSKYTVKKYELNEVKPSLDMIEKISSSLKISKNNLLETKSNKKEYHADFNRILDLADDLFKEIYNYSKNKDKLNLSANELINKEKYFLTDLANIFKDSTFTKLRQLEQRFKNHDNLPRNKPLKIKFASNETKKDDNGGVVEYANTVEITNKLNDPEYLKHKIEKYKQYLENTKKGIDNYKLEENKIEAAKKEYLEKKNKEKNKPRKATQEDIDKLLR